MSSLELKRSRLGKELGWAAAAVGVCCAFVLRYLWRTGSFLNLQLYAAGREAMPFQGRILMAWVFRLTAANPHLAAPLTRIAIHLPQAFQSPYSVVLIAIDIPAMLLGLWITRLTLERLTHDKTFSAWASFLFCYMAYFNLIIGYGIFMMPYDIVSLLFFTLGVWLVVTNRFALLTALCIPAALNRETSIFITLFFGLYAWFNRKNLSSRQNTWLAFALQLFIWTGVRLWIRHLYPASPDVYVWQLPKNLVSLVKPQNWPLFFSLFGFTLPLFITQLHRIGNTALANATVIASILWWLGMMFVGVIVEIRIFSELAAFLLPCIALILRSLILDGGLLDPAAQRTTHATSPR